MRHALSLRPLPLLGKSGKTSPPLIIPEMDLTVPTTGTTNLAIDFSAIPAGNEVITITIPAGYPFPIQYLQ